MNKIPGAVHLNFAPGILLFSFLNRSYNIYSYEIKKYSPILFSLPYSLFNSITVISPGHQKRNGTKPPIPSLTFIARLPL